MLRRAVFAYLLVAAIYVAATVFLFVSVAVPAVYETAIIVFAISLAVYFAFTVILGSVEARYTDSVWWIVGFFVAGALAIPIFEFRERRGREARVRTPALHWIGVLMYVALSFAFMAWSIIVAMTTHRQTPAYRTLARVDTYATWLVWLLMLIEIWRGAGRRVASTIFTLLLPWVAAPLRYLGRRDQPVPAGGDQRG